MNNIFDQSCFTTRFLGAISWDSKGLREVYSIDFSSDSSLILQEKGRYGRHNLMDDKIDNYTATGSLSDIEYDFKG